MSKTVEETRAAKAKLEQDILELFQTFAADYPDVFISDIIMEREGDITSLMSQPIHLVEIKLQIKE